MLKDLSKSNFSLDKNKPFLILFVGIVLLLVLIYATGGRIYSGIVKTLSDTKQTEKDVSLLSTKIASLQSLKLDLNSQDVKSINISFPDEDSSLFLFSQLKTLANENGVILKEISFNPPAVISSDISKSNISFKIDGEKTSVESFISAIPKIAPLSGLGAMNFSTTLNSDGLFEISASVETYSSPLPETLPSEESGIKVLTDDEKQKFDALKNLRVMSTHVGEAQPAGDGTADPFFGTQIIVENPTPTP